MASSRTTPSTTTVEKPTAQEVELSAILPHPNNPRTQLGDIKELTDSIREHGILEPLVVEPHPDDPGTYLLITGHRRRAAALAAGLDTVLVLVRPATELGDQVATMLVENLHRADLTPIEEGDAYQQMLDLGYSPDAVAKKTGRAKKTVQARVKVAGLPESARDRILNGQLTLEDAAKMARYAKEPALITRLEQAARVGAWRFQDELNAIASEKATARKKAENLKALRDRSYPVVNDVDQVPDDALDLDDVVSIRSSDDFASTADASVGVVADFYEQAHQVDRKLCEGHMVLQYGNDASLIYAYCTTPDKHPDWSVQGEPLADALDAGAAVGEGSTSAPSRPKVGDDRAERAERAERAAADEARLQRRRELAVAAATRRTFLREVMTGPDGEAMATWVAHENLYDKLGIYNGGFYDKDDARVLAQVLFPNATVEFLIDDAQVLQRLKDRVETLSLPEAVLSLHILNSIDDLLENPSSGWWWDLDRKPGSRRELWVRDLINQWGYPLTDVEQRMIDAATPSRRTTEEDGDQA